jgi:hypothetical protein
LACWFLRGAGCLLLGDDWLHDFISFAFLFLSLPDLCVYDVSVISDIV